MDRDRTSITASAALTGAGALLAALLLVRLVVPALPILAAPGAFLWDRFHAASFFLPFYLIVSARLISGRMWKDRVLALNLTFFPFVTAAILLSLMFDAPAEYPAVTAFFADSFSLDGAVVFLFLLFSAECLAILRFVLLRGASGAGGSDARSAYTTRATVENDPDDMTPPAGSRLAGLIAGAVTATAARRAAEPETVPAPTAAMEAEIRVEPDIDDDGAESGAAAVDDDEAVPAVELTLEELEALQAEFPDDPAADDAISDDAFEEARQSLEEDFAYDEEWPDDLDESGESPEADWYEDPPDTVEEEELTLVFRNGVFEPSPVPVAADSNPKPAVSPASRSPRKKPGYSVPIEGLLDDYPDGQYWVIDETTRAAGETVRGTLQEFKIEAEVTGIRKGPVITMFEMLPARGVKLANIVNLADNIALRLAASRVRIVAPIPGKHAVGIEVPNKHRAIVGFGDLLTDSQFTSSKMKIPIALGKDIPGDTQIVDLTRMPHLLIAGATGSGKSVCVNSIICSILYRRTPAEVKMILIDPKIVELKFYNDIPHLLTPVITDPKRAFQALQYAIYEMENRYTLLDSIGARDIHSYNAKIKTRNLALQPLPYIVIVVDEFADLMATSGKELETTLARLAAMSRAVGIHLVLATQRPSTDVISGLIKANFPSRIAFKVSSKIESRIIIDTMGADKLLGQGDMLFTSAWDPFPKRIQGAFLSDDEVERVIEHVKTLGEPDYIDDEIFIEEDDEESFQGELEDPLMEKAVQIVVSSKKASASYLQRRLKVGYNRAARLVEEMERLGIVGPQNGSKAREIINIPGHVS